MTLGSLSGIEPLGKLHPLDELADEYLARLRGGEEPDIENHAAKHPELADQIRELLPAMALLEDLAPGSADDGARAGDAGVAPAELGEYRILREIGRGGMGVVYAAEHVPLGPHVALKVLPCHSLLDLLPTLTIE